MRSFNATLTYQLTVFKRVSGLENKDVGGAGR